MWNSAGLSCGIKTFLNTESFSNGLHWVWFSKEHGSTVQGLTALYIRVFRRHLGLALSSHFCLYRHVLLPKEIAKLVPKRHLMSETEWRSLGVQQSQGWEHYMKHDPGMYTCLIRNQNSFLTVNGSVYMSFCA